MKISSNRNKKLLPVRTEMRCAIIRPPITANPVQSECPKIPPTITPYTLSRAAKMMVVNCDRSPHSAKNVIENAWIRTRYIIDLVLLLLGLRVGVGVSVVFTSTCGSSVTTVTTPRSTSGKRVVDVAVSFSNCFFSKEGKRSIIILESIFYHWLESIQ